jgi:hypothetical protein
MSVDGYRWDTPNPATPRLAPSPMSATASAADITLLIGKTLRNRSRRNWVCETIQSVMAIGSTARP